MIFFKKKLSDDEYVEQVRKRDLAGRRLQWVWLILFLVSIFALKNFPDLIDRWSGLLNGKNKFVFAGIFLGFTFGLMLATIVVQTGICLKLWINARTGFRTERLMLKYHDELSGGEPAKKPVPATGENAQA